MAIIKTYPLKSNYYGPDRLILSDMQPDDLGVVHGATKSLTLSSLKSFIGGGAATLQLTTQNTSGAATFDVDTNTLNIPVYTGDTYTLQAEAKSGISVPLKLDASTGTDSTVNLTEGANVTLTRNSANEIEISATGGNAGVSSITNAFGTYIAGTSNSAATGAVGLGTIDLNAADGTSDSSTRFLSKDNTWDIISAAGSNTQFQYNNSGAFEGTPLMVITGNDEIQIGQQTNEQGKLIVSGQAAGTSGLIKIEGKSTRGVTFSVQPETNVNYDVIFPDTGPGGNNKILESDTSGNLAWISTPTGINVVGNPSGTASADLSKITIGSTIYAIPTQGLTSVGLSAPPAFSVTGSPLTSNGSISIGVTGGTAGEFLGHNGQWATPSNTTYSVMGSGNSYAAGLVLAGSSTHAGNFLRKDGTWVVPAYPNPSAPSSTSLVALSINGTVYGIPQGTGNGTITAVSGQSGISGAFTSGPAVLTNSDRGSSQNIFKTIATPTNDVVASSNNDTLTLVAGSNTGIFINGSGSQVTIGLYAPTNLALGGIKLSSSAATTDLTATYQTATAGTGINNRVYPVQLNSANEAGVYVPWSGGSSGISFSGTTSGGLATYTNSSTAGVSSKVTLNASGLMEFDADNAGGSRASIDYNPTGNRLQIGDFSGGSAIVELYTDGNRQFQIGVNGEIGLGEFASQGTNGQVLTSQGNGSPAYWTNKTTVPSNVVTGSGTIYEVPMWNPQSGTTGSYIGGGGGFNSSPFKSNASGQSIISTEVNGGITFRNGSGQQATINGGTSSGAPYQINLPGSSGASSGKVLAVSGVSGSIIATSWQTPSSNITSLTGTTSVNSSTFANTPFTFANTNTGSGVGAPLATQVGGAYGNKHIAFYLGTTYSGGINQSGSSAVNYATSSDYRLKENVVEMTGAIDRVKQLKPSRFNFIADGPSRIVDGFLAHEVSSIVPESITGDKDAVDAESNIIPQGIDQSKLVPLLVGAIKELTARIEALEA